MNETMKSYISSMESKYRSEGRHILPRRRVATKTSNCENGDFEMELSLAIQESLKYAKEKEGHLKRVDKTSPLLNGLRSEESFSRMAGKMLCTSSNDQSEEIKQLKDLLLIHIELIQHQQELLANKDKEIRTLRAEKDSIQCRLQKVERRVSLLKQKEESHETHVPREVVPETEPPMPPDKTKKIVKLEQATKQQIRKRKQKVKQRRPSKTSKRSSQTDHESESEFVTSSEQDDSESETESEEEKEADRGKMMDVGDVHIDETEEDSSKMKSDEENQDPFPAPLLRTECLYHVSCCVEVPPEDPVELLEEKEVHMGDQVEIPDWRIKMLTNRYQLEGTENITDEAYQKRHQKLEMEEKRRKRWDIQRMREQRVFEKLRGQEESAAQNSSDDKSNVHTFLPSIDDFTHIEVQENVPVMAFGQAIPHIEPSEFELPWDTSLSTNTNRKSHSSRCRQK